MDRETYRQALFAHSRALGCERAEAYYAAGEAFSVNVSDGVFDRYEVSASGGLSLRVTVNDRDGYAYTEAFDDPEGLVRAAVENARTIENGDERPMQTKQAYQPVPPRISPLSEKSEADKIALALALEQAVKAADHRVARLMYCEAGSSQGIVELANTLGLDARRASAQSYIYAMPVLTQKEESRTGFAFRTGEAVFDIEGLAREAAADGARKFGASPVPSGSYRTLLSNRAAQDLLSAFCPMFSAEEAQQGRSLLFHREGTRIAADCVSIIDDPFHPASPRPFDGEGTPGRTKRVVDAGTLTTLLHNLKTAKKAGCETTGNAVRASGASPVGVGISVFYIEPGETEPGALEQRLDKGLLITDLEGLHAGLSCVSGDFSLKAEGYLIENGRRVRPVTEITVAGNFLTLLSSVEALGSDLFFGLPSGAMAGAPSLLISSLAVAGK